MPPPFWVYGRRLFDLPIVMNAFGFEYSGEGFDHFDWIKVTAVHPASCGDRQQWVDCVEKLFSRIEFEILIRRRPGNRNKRSNLMRLRNNNIRISPLLSEH